MLIREKVATCGISLVSAEVPRVVGTDAVGFYRFLSAEKGQIPYQKISYRIFTRARDATVLR